MSALPFLIALSLSSAAPPASPAPGTAPVQLDVVRDHAGACPDAATLRARVRERTGDGSVVDVAARHVIVSFSGTDEGVVASVRLLDEQGDRGRRELGPMPADCRALGGAVVLAVSLVVQPPATMPTATPPDDVVEIAGDGAQAAAPARRGRAGRPVTIPDFEPRRARRPFDADAVHADASVGAGLGAGVVPGTGIVIDVSARVGTPVLHLGADVTGHLPGAEPRALGHELSSQALLVGLDGCVGSGHDAVGIDACVGVGAGVVRSVVDDAEGAAVLAPAVVPRVTATLGIEVAPRWAVVVGARAGLPTARLVLRTDDDVLLWSTPDVAFALGLGIRTTFGP